MQRRALIQQLAGSLALFAGCSGLTRSEPQSPSESPTPTATAMSAGSATGTETGTASLPASLAAGGYEVTIMDLDVRASTAGRRGVHDQRGLNYLVLTMEPSFSDIERIEFTNRNPFELRLDGEGRSAGNHAVRLDPFVYAIGVPVGEYQSAEVVLTPGPESDRWRVPDRIVDRFSAVSEFSVDFWVPSLAEQGGTATATLEVENRGTSAGTFNFIIYNHDGPADNGVTDALALRSGERRTETYDFDMPATRSTELVLDTGVRWVRETIILKDEL